MPSSAKFCVVLLLKLYSNEENHFHYSTSDFFRVRPTVSPTDINIKAPSLLTPRSVEGAEGGDCEVIELTPASRPYASSDQDCSRDHSPSPTEELEHGFRSVELHVPGIEGDDLWKIPLKKLMARWHSLP